MKLIQAVHGLVFFGVPNDGMDIKSLIPMAGDGPNRSLIESLSSSNSQMLRTLHQEFHDILGSGRMILCFYETELSPTAQKAWLQLRKRNSREY
jgi:hypothetical protein